MQEFLSDASIVAALDIESGIVFFYPLILLLASCFQLCETSPSQQTKSWANVVAMPTPGGCRSTMLANSVALCAPQGLVNGYVCTARTCQFHHLLGDLIACVVRMMLVPFTTTVVVSLLLRCL